MMAGREFEWVTPGTRARQAADAWSDQYSRWTYGERKMEILQELRALGGEATAEQVNATIGNSSWTSTRCDHCGARDVPVAVLGEEPDWESRMAHVCPECLAAALAAAPCDLSG